MARLPRQHQKIFASNATNSSAFGGAAQGNIITTENIEQLQGLDAFENGWSSATISGDNLPVMEEDQGLHKIETSQLAYIFQEGLPEWDNATEYYTNSFVKGSDANIYRSVIDNNININPVGDTTESWVNYIQEQIDISIENKMNRNFNNATFETATGTNAGARLGKPSSRYIGISIGNSGSTYTASATGWIYASFAAGNNLCSITLSSNNFSVSNIINSGTTNQGLQSIIPIAQGETFTYSYNGNGTPQQFRMIYDKGWTTTGG